MDTFLLTIPVSLGELVFAVLMPLLVVPLLLLLVPPPLLDLYASMPAARRAEREGGGVAR